MINAIEFMKTFNFLMIEVLFFVGCIVLFIFGICFIVCTILWLLGY